MKTLLPILLCLLALPARGDLRLNENWQMMTDAENAGVAQRWYSELPPGVKYQKDAKAGGFTASDDLVPPAWMACCFYPGYHGVEWYWNSFTCPARKFEQGRFLLRFEQVNYACQVWLNGQLIGRHEGGEFPFAMDVTHVIRPFEQNLLAVRVVNLGTSPVDGFEVDKVPHRPLGYGLHVSGITGAVTLQQRPSAYIENVFFEGQPDGTVTVRAEILNTSSEPQEVSYDILVTDARDGSIEERSTGALTTLVPGKSGYNTTIQIRNPRLWSPETPNLYRGTVRLKVYESSAEDELSARFGCRKFEFRDGAFRLNGRRVLLRSTHLGPQPMLMGRPANPALIRRDLILLKAMGFNAIRFIWGAALPEQLDCADEIGLMVYDETFAANPMSDSPELRARFADSVGSMIREHRNHPSIVIWGLLNETRPGPAFDVAQSFLPELLPLDSSRMVILDSGNWHKSRDSGLSGTFANPGSKTWSDDFQDVHPYQYVPHTAEILQFLRNYGSSAVTQMLGHNNAGRDAFSDRPIFFSEYGVGSAADVLRLTRYYEQHGATGFEDFVRLQAFGQRFLADWERWRLADAFGRPEDFFEQSKAKMARQRTLGMNALRANPRIIGYSLTNAAEPCVEGEGVVTHARELKYGTVDALADAWAPLRWCVFAEPVQLWAGEEILLEAVLANEDALAPGSYPVRIEVFGPDGKSHFNQNMDVTIPEGGEELPLALPVFSQRVKIDGPSGQYRLTATFQRGALACGGTTEFFVTRREEVPSVTRPVALWGEDAELAAWLDSAGIPRNDSAESTILVGRHAPGDSPEARKLAFDALFQRVADGATVVFLCPEVLTEDGKNFVYLPFQTQGTIETVSSWLYLADEWGKAHPFFDRLPLGEWNGANVVVPGRSGGLLNNIYYRELISNRLMVELPSPFQSVAGGMKVTNKYTSGLYLGVWTHGRGRIVLNSFNLRGNLNHPVGNVMVRNLLK